MRRSPISRETLHVNESGWQLDIERIEVSFIDSASKWETIEYIAKKDQVEIRRGGRDRSTNDKFNYSNELFRGEFYANRYAGAGELKRASDTYIVKIGYLIRDAQKNFDIKILDNILNVVEDNITHSLFIFPPYNAEEKNKVLYVRILI